MADNNIDFNVNVGLDGMRERVFGVGVGRNVGGDKEREKNNDEFQTILLKDFDERNINEGNEGNGGHGGINKFDPE
eukprot:CAMPEP_0116914808 /NCGR_PEP_ID=MMETSP0467-20121206/17547_1 /TAXON_ID=283647 /ORGANISM="Mesodinium pulex, Strain SPMC105" /LENGTH=75 /DNA_ID=CAMNT_0004591339 /DNA_START=983 /DNA_END=1210 /DNA_ORIENTATION=-